MPLRDAKSGCDVDPTLRPDSQLAFRRPGRQTHGAHRTQGIIFADELRKTDLKSIHQGSSAIVQRSRLVKIVFLVITFKICSFPFPFGRSLKKVFLNLPKLHFTKSIRSSLFIVPIT